VSVLTYDSLVGWGLAAGTLTLGLFLSWIVERRIRSFRASQRALSGVKAEDRALRLLEKQGYVLVERPFTMDAHVLVNGNRLSSPVRADFLVQRGGQKYAVEVKSTARAANPAFPDTRRQLLEYWSASPHPLLLVDMAQEVVTEIDFSYSPESPSRGKLRERLWMFLLALGLGVGMGWLL
jgi:hypothetical protein